MHEISNLVNPRLNQIPSSLIRRVNQKYGAIKDIVKLTIGEPDFVTPDHIKLAAIQSILDNHSHYAPNRGTAGLLQAISDYLLRRYQLTYNPQSQLIVTNGATEAISTVINGMIGPNDVVLIPSPAFSLYETVTLQNGGVPVTIDTSQNDFKLTPAVLKSYLETYAGRVKLVVLNYPNNPTGVTLTSVELQALAAVLKTYDVAVLSDEVYSELSYSVDHVSIASLLPDQTLYINGVSKAYAMTGWRVGYLAGQTDVIGLLAKVHQANVATIGSLNMDAATEAFLNGDGDPRRMKAIYEERQRYLTHALIALGYQFVEPQGAFYVYVEVPATFTGSANDYTDLLAEKAKIATVPGEAFESGGSHYFRISYATSLDNLKLAVSRLTQFVNTQSVKQ
ncbi:aminotransferase class I/II-fold pyridoxal phosphate-dependent enzyme [Secundilactobacillus paracollinoides]|uniref:aminotransferase class I/II-fold pyridoxal phosphate-dependent enzyme n=1 Tax=Secundilactobacillus paracollinoides TaxID=240427 RepID=UPI0006D2A8FE|nr:aminotransferase class I/II-fold pyridoxal phosphate-dependent enzyme [Secundilactobacillus paracollinoides]KRL77032.1 aspartate tyrosine aromatic aminotransferase [Secundilactobacillus paracollinoides DSM 15502 = JCM 11969]